MDGINTMKRTKVLALLFCLLPVGCSRESRVGPSVEFTRVPVAQPGGPSAFDTIEGRVIGGRAGQEIVLYAKSGPWYVQPYADQPFTHIRPDSTWSSPTHLGTDYAVLLVEPGYSPPATINDLPGVGGSVAAVAVIRGKPPFWETWWFICLCVAIAVTAAAVFHRMRTRQLTRQLNMRFEERLAERTRIAQEIHDTLLQGFLSASMQLHIAADQVPENSPAKPQLGRVLQLMGQVIEEGRNAVRGLRASPGSTQDLEQAFANIQQELGMSGQVDFRIVREGQPSPLHPIIRDEVYRIGREALVNAFRHSGASQIELEMESAPAHLRLLVRDNGRGIDPAVLKEGRDGHWGLSGMRDRAERIGARLKVWSRPGAGTEVELNVPAHIAFEKPHAALPAPRREKA